MDADELRPFRFQCACFTSRARSMPSDRRALSTSIETFFALDLVPFWVSWRRWFPAWVLESAIRFVLQVVSLRKARRSSRSLRGRDAEPSMSAEHDLGRGGVRRPRRSVCPINDRPRPMFLSRVFQPHGASPDLRGQHPRPAWPTAASVPADRIPCLKIPRDRTRRGAGRRPSTINWLGRCRRERPRLKLRWSRTARPTVQGAC